MAVSRGKAAAGGAFAIALGLLAVLEGFGPKAGPGVYRSYVDIANVVTICRGHTGRDVKVGQTATEAECQAYDERDLGIAFAAEDRYIRQVEELKPHVRASMALFILNVGTEAFRTSTVRRLLNFEDPHPSWQVRAHHRLDYTDRDIPGACRALMRYVKAKVNGKMVVVQGLINRRERERRLCMGELP